MNKLAIIAILAIVLLACTPMMPSRNQTINKTTEISEQTEQTEQTETPIESSEPELSEPETTVDTKDLPVKEVIAGELVNFPNLKAVDPDGDPITYTFSSPLNEKGEWKTTEEEVGEHVITITASDGTNTVSQQVLIKVNPKNRPPIIELEQPVQGTEGETITLEPQLVDPDGDEVTITFSGWMDTNTKETTYGDSGNHKVIITATDGKATTTKEVIISISQANRAPILSDISPIKVKEGQTAKIEPNARDPDGDKITFVYEFPFDDTGVWNTEIGDAGEYEVIIKATDGQLTSEKTVQIIVETVNKAPVIEMQPTVTVKEGEKVTLNPTITDPEGDEFRVTYSGWMTSTIKETGYDDAGNYKVTITARDTAGNEAKFEVLIVVEDQNRPPIFGAGSFD